MLEVELSAAWRVSRNLASVPLCELLKHLLPIAKGKVEQRSLLLWVLVHPASIGDPPNEAEASDVASNVRRDSERLPETAKLINRLDVDDLPQKIKTVSSE